MKNFTAIIPALFLLLPQTARAWGRVGHEAIAQIAEDIIKRDDPRLYDWIHDINGRDEDGNFVSLANISACADGMKGRSFRGGSVIPGPLTITWCAKSFPVPVMPQSGSWHYIDIPVSENPAPATVENYCKDDKGRKGECATEKIRHYISELQNADNNKDRRFALLMIVHLYGDLHQPMHCVDDGDRGGNSKRLHLDGSPTNLHSVWDNLIEPRVKEKAADYGKRMRAGSNIPKFADYVGILEGQVTKKDASDWLQGNQVDYLIDDAAFESFDIAKHQIYPLYRDSLGVDVQEAYIDLVNDQYFDKMKPITEDRIKKGGVRLAFLLRSVMDPLLDSKDKPISGPSSDVAIQNSPYSRNLQSNELTHPGPAGPSQGLVSAMPASQEGSLSDSEFAQALQETEKEIAVHPVKIDSKKWSPSPKLSSYKRSAEFHAILQILNLNRKHIDDAVEAGIDIRNEVDRAIYRRAQNPVGMAARQMNRGSRDWAVVFDIDETLLDSSPFMHLMDENNGGRIDAVQRGKWIDAAKAKAVPGAKEFMKFIRPFIRESNGYGHIVFISDRDSQKDAATKANLRALEFYEAGDIMLNLRNGDDTKSVRRACIEYGNKGKDPRCSSYRPMKIIASFGSSLRDFVPVCTYNAAMLYQDTLQWGEIDWPLWNDEYGAWQNNYACAN